MFDIDKAEFWKETLNGVFIHSAINTKDLKNLIEASNWKIQYYRKELSNTELNHLELSLIESRIEHEQEVKEIYQRWSEIRLKTSETDQSSPSNLNGIYLTGLMIFFIILICKI